MFNVKLYNDIRAVKMAFVLFLFCFFFFVKLESNGWSFQIKGERLEMPVRKKNLVCFLFTFLKPVTSS